MTSLDSSCHDNERPCAEHERTARACAAALDHAAALEAIEHAIAACAASDHRTQLTRLRAHVASDGGDARAAAHWQAWMRTCMRSRNDEGYAEALVHLYWENEDGTEGARLRHAQHMDPINVGWAARAAACTTMLSGDYAGAIVHDERALAIATRANDRRLEAAAREKLAVCYAYGGKAQPAMEMLESVIVLTRAEGMTRDAWRASLTLADLYADELRTDDQLRTVRSAAWHAAEFGTAEMLRVTRAFEASALVNLGFVEDARIIAQELLDDAPSVGKSVFEAAASAQIAHVLHESGDIAVAAQATHRALETTSACGFASFQFEAAWDAARLDVLQGNLDEAFVRATELIIDEPAAQARVSLWALHVATLHSEDRFVELAADLMSRVDPDASVLARRACDEIATTARAAASGRTSELAAIAASWDAYGMHLQAARVRAHLAVLTADVGLLTRACQQLAGCGARGDVTLLTTFLRTSGTGRKGGHAFGKRLGSLTVRETEVVELACAGRTNKDIARLLRIGVATVEKHLSSAYAKTGARNRVDLAVQLRKLVPST